MQAHPYGALPRRQRRLGRSGPNYALAFILIVLAMSLAGVSLVT